MDEAKRINCDEVLDGLSEFLDAEARADLCREIEEHLRHCHDCQVEVDTVKKTIVLYQSDRVTEVPLTTSHRLRAALSGAYDGKPS